MWLESDRSTRGAAQRSFSGREAAGHNRPSITSSITGILAGWLGSVIPRRSQKYHRRNPVVFMALSLLLLSGWDRVSGSQVLAASDRLRNVRESVEGMLLSGLSAGGFHERLLAGQAELMVQGMYEVDRKKLERAFEEKNSSFSRALWRFGLDPVDLEVRIDGVTHHFWSDEILFNRYREQRLFFFQKPFFRDRGEFLPWELFRAVQYDQLPHLLTDMIAGIQIERFGRYLDPDVWPGMDLEQWREVPDFIQKIAAYRMVWHWAQVYAPPGMRGEEAARIVASIGRVESLFDTDKVVNRDPVTGRQDLGFMQISDILRRQLQKLPEFRDYREEDYLTPWVSIKVGTYSFFSVFLDGASGDVLAAIGHYNTGRRGPQQQAEKYRSAVIRQHNLSFVDRHYSPMLRRILQTAEPAYFHRVREDRLYSAAQPAGG
jgi:hypothetical protein